MTSPAINHEFTDVRAHHLVPKREGSLGGEPTYVQACACGVTYRHGLLYPPVGVHAAPYDREAAIEAALVDVAVESMRRAMEEHGVPLTSQGRVAQMAREYRAQQEAPPADTKLADLLDDDRSTWPEGHPCRDCGRLFKEHPAADCEGWR